MINRGKRRKIWSEVNPDKNLNKNLQSFLVISPVQQEVVLSHKLLKYVYKQQNPFRIKEENRNHLIHPTFCHIDQTFQESLIQYKIHILE